MLQQSTPTPTRKRKEKKKHFVEDRNEIVYYMRPTHCFEHNEIEWKHWHQWYHSKDIQLHSAMTWRIIKHHAYYSLWYWKRIINSKTKKALIKIYQESWHVLQNNKRQKPRRKERKWWHMRIAKSKRQQEHRHYLSNLYPCNKDSARIVFVEVARQPNKAAQNPNILKLSSVTDVRRIPPTMGIKEAQIRQSKYFLQTSHCKTTVQIPLYQMQLGYNSRIILKSKERDMELC